MKLPSKDDVRKKYPDFKDENVNFYLGLLTDYVRVSLGMVTKEKLLALHFEKEVKQATLVSQNIEDTLREAREKDMLDKKKVDPIQETIQNAKSQRILIEAEVNKAIAESKEQKRLDEAMQAAGEVDL